MKFSIAVHMLNVSPISISPPVTYMKTKIVPTTPEIKRLEETSFCSSLLVLFVCKMK